MTLRLIRDSFAVHVWNFMCKKGCDNEMKPGTPIHAIAERNCLLTIESMHK